MTLNAGILIVDDNEINRDICAMHLEDLQLPLFFADNGYIGLQAAKKYLPDLILLDIMMPKMDGFQMLTELKKDPQLKDIPVLMLTAKSETESVVKAFEMGADDYLKKPFEEEEMVARIKTLLKNRYLEKKQAIDLAAGAAMQQKFLTDCGAAAELCKKAHLAIEIFNRPYGSISGDFYYSYLNGNSEVVFFIGDSCGHGLPAALISMRIIGFLQQLGYGRYLGDNILTRLNEDISGLLPLGNFVAATSITFHEKMITISNGGQPYPILISEHGIIELEDNGLPLGFKKGYQYGKKSFPFNPGDRLILYTDGMTETINSKEQDYGKKRLYACLKKHGTTLPLADLLQTINSDISQFQKDEDNEDDQTMIIFEKLKSY